MATIFESQTIDYETGEIKLSSTIKASRYDETFGMYRTTHGLDWIFQFTGNELQFLMLLCNLGDDSFIVRLTPLLRKQIANEMGKKERYIRDILSSLEVRNGISRITKSDLILNPRFFYKGGSKNLKQRIEDYDKIREQFVKTQENKVLQKI